MDKNTKKIVMIAGIGVGAYILYRMMKKDTTSTLPKILPPEVIEVVDDEEEEAPFDALDYAKNEFGVNDATAKQISSKANYILNHPEGDWYKHTVKRASEEMREIPQQALHEAWWVINAPNRRLEYVENTWSLNQEQAKEVIDYVENKIKPNASWVSDAEVKAKERGRSVEKQLLHEAHWQLYTKDDAKYAFTG